MPSFERHGERGVDRIGFAPAALIMAGWTGRDRAAVDHHIAELAALGVPGPSRVPTFYRLDPALLAGLVAEIWVVSRRCRAKECRRVRLADFSCGGGIRCVDHNPK